MNDSGGNDEVTAVALLHDVEDAFANRIRPYTPRWGKSSQAESDVQIAPSRLV